MLATMYFVQCDRCDRPAPQLYSPGQAVQAAEKGGFVSHDGEDLCPDCAKEQALDPK
jgi:hypothetical protein